LITDGTKSTLLSTSVRLFQNLEAAGQDATLDIYEGMWHVFQYTAIPETEVSLKKISKFLNQHLKN
jgi:epsilon-lactone hydrolase